VQIHPDQITGKDAPSGVAQLTQDVIELSDTRPLTTHGSGCHDRDHEDPFTRQRSVDRPSRSCVWALLRSGHPTRAYAHTRLMAAAQAAQGVLSATMLTSPLSYAPHDTPLGWLAVGLIFAAFGRILDRGVAMRAELDTVI
jgi:hypothetical protein